MLCHTISTVIKTIRSDAYRPACDSQILPALVQRLSQLLMALLFWHPHMDVVLCHQVLHQTRGQIPVLKVS
jgi:hypothetical protein